MADQHLLQRTPAFPSRVPVSLAELQAWALELQQAIRDQHLSLADRLQGLITVGTLAQRPAADGTFRFYFATDEAPPKLYFDDGIWNVI